MPDLEQFGGSSLSGDLAFLVKKEFDSKLRSAEGFKSTTGDLCTLTASGGKDMYIARAKVVMYGLDNISTSGAKVELKINGTIVETAQGKWAVNTGGGGGSFQTVVYEFKNIGHKVATTEIIKLEVVTIASNIDVEGFIECFEEDTGVDPTK